MFYDIPTVSVTALDSTSVTVSVTSPASPPMGQTDPLYVFQTVAGTDLATVLPCYWTTAGSVAVCTLTSLTPATTYTVRVASHPVTL